LCGIREKKINIKQFNIPMDNSKESQKQNPNNTPLRLDPKGYFLIRILDGNIECGHFDYDKKLIKKYSGKTAEEIYRQIISDNAVSSFEHAAYLGKELKKAELASKYNIKYVQDDEISI
jgi:hypothetical protein